MASGGSKIWSTFSLVTSLFAAVVAKKVADKTWTLATGKRPPENPADPDVALGEAVLWAGLSGTAVGLARMVAQRRATSYYVRSTGHLPQQLERDDQEA